MTTRRSRKLGNRLRIRNWIDAVVLLLVSAVACVFAAYAASGLNEEHTAAFGHVPVGSPMGSFSLKTLDGRDYDSAAKLKNKVAVLIFWRTDQEFSKQALVALKTLHDELGAGDVEFVAICSGQTPLEEIRQTVADMRVDFPVLLDPDRIVYGQMGIRVYPATGFFGREGKLQFVYGGYRRDFAYKTRNYLEKLLGKITPEEFAKRMAPGAGGMPEHPQLGLADYNLGVELVRQEKYGEARNCLEKAWQRDPSILPAGIELGFIYLRTEEYPRALEVFDKVLNKIPASPRAIAGKGIALVNMGRDAEGMALLVPLLANGFKEPLAYYTVAESLEKGGKQGEALTYYKRGLKIASGLLWGGDGNK